MTMELFSDDYVNKADQIFLKPNPTYLWNEIIEGVNVNSANGTNRKLLAVAQNTFRGFHRIDKSCAGAKEGFIEYFVSNKEMLIQRLKNVETRQNLHDVSNNICVEIRDFLHNCQQGQLESYNKLRKPIDLYIEHLVSMATELKEQRQKLVPLLFLPLDSQIFAHPELFSNQELKACQLGRNSTYQDVRIEKNYWDLQELLFKKSLLVAQKRERTFSVIYYDLIWNRRYENWGGNLFETNPL